MDLKYRGIAYPASSGIAAFATEDNASFLGARFTRSHYSAPQRQQSAAELMFLGNRYTR